VSAPAPLAELATAAQRVGRLHAAIPRVHRPTDRAVYGALDAAREDVVRLTARGRADEARAIVADWEHEVSSRLMTRLAHAPLSRSEVG
jgi:hypothetical protein